MEDKQNTVRKSPAGPELHGRKANTGWLIGGLIALVVVVGGVMLFRDDINDSMGAADMIRGGEQAGNQAAPEGTAQPPAENNGNQGSGTTTQ